MADRSLASVPSDASQSRRSKLQSQWWSKQQPSWPIMYPYAPPAGCYFWPPPTTCLTSSLQVDPTDLIMTVPSWSQILPYQSGESYTMMNTTTAIVASTAAAPMTTNGPATIKIRRVWAHNLESEFILIREALVHYRFATIDTEFPGIIHRSHVHPAAQTPEERYALLKSNVDDLQIIQMGLTLSDEYCRHPEHGIGTDGSIWEFNFRGFDPIHNPHNPESLKMLKAQGIDFNANQKLGVDPLRFAELAMASGLVLNNSALIWIGFQHAIDFGFLLKILLGAAGTAELPQTLQAFHDHIRHFFGFNVYDTKYMIKFCHGLFGGLENVARTLKIERTVGKRHQAGSDSLLTWQVFCKMHEIYFASKGGGSQHVDVLYGLDVM